MSNPITLTEEILKAFPCLKDVGLVEAFYVDGELHTTTTNGGVREYGCLLDDWAESEIKKLENNYIDVSDVVFHEKIGKAFEVKSIFGKKAMCYELDGGLNKIPRTAKNGMIERLIDKTISYRTSLLDVKNLKPL